MCFRHHYRKSSSFTLAHYIGLSLVPSVLLSVLAAVYDSSDTSKQHIVATILAVNVLKIFQIAFNLLLVAFLLVQLSRMNIYNGDSRYRAFHKSNKNYPCFLLAKRLVLYPIVYSIARMPNIVYNFTTNDDLRAYMTTTNPSTTTTVLAFLAAIFQPSAGLGCFAIFLSYQPIAQQHLKKIVLRFLPRLTCCFKESSRGGGGGGGGDGGGGDGGKQQREEEDESESESESEARSMHSSTTCYRRNATTYFDNERNSNVAIEVRSTTYIVSDSEWPIRSTDTNGGDLTLDDFDEGMLVEEVLRREQLSCSISISISDSINRRNSSKESNPVMTPFVLPLQQVTSQASSTKPS